MEPHDTPSKANGELEDADPLELESFFGFENSHDNFLGSTTEYLPLANGTTMHVARFVNDAFSSDTTLASTDLCRRVLQDLAYPKTNAKEKSVDAVLPSTLLMFRALGKAAVTSTTIFRYIEGRLDA